MRLINLVKNHLRLLLVVVILMAIGSYIFYRSYQSNLYKDPLRFNPAKDVTSSVQTKNIERKLTLSGSIKAEQQAQLQFQTPGLVTWVGVKVGDHVKKNQAIASLDKRQLQKNLQAQLNTYLTHRSAFEQTQANYQATRSNYLVTDAIQRILDQAQYDLNNSVINVEIQDLAIKLATLTTPIDGIVTNATPAFAGVNVLNTQANYEITNPDTLYFTANIDQDEVANIHLGQKATLVLDNQPDAPIDTTITYISFEPVAGESSTVYEVRFALPVSNQTLTYRVGMTGDSNIVTASSADALVIPLDALNDNGTKKFVYLKNSTPTLNKQVVSIGVQNTDEVEITKGLTSHDTVVIKK